MAAAVRARLRALITYLSTSVRVVAAYRLAVPVVVAALLWWLPGAAYAEPGTVAPAVTSLPQVIDNLKVWVMGILWSVAGLYALLGAVYRMTAGGDTEQVTAGNRALKNALVGAALAVLSPILLDILKGIVGG